MGCAASNRQTDERLRFLYQGTTEELERDEEIEMELRHDRIVRAETSKLLILGNADSGKSTLVKQMKILHTGGFTEFELINYRYLVFNNIVEAIESLVKGAAALKIFFNTQTQKNVTAFLTLSPEEFGFNVPVLSLAFEIWQSPDIQQCFARRHDLQLSDNVEYFLSNLERIATEDYMPTNMDVLYCRSHTSGVHCTEFNQMGRQIKLIDVGGQKSERKKWIHVFDDVTAILFVAALSGYDQVLEEKHTENRMFDALALFDEMCNSDLFLQTAIVLFLNKKDVFEEKIKHVPLSVCFTEYTGVNDYKHASEYIQSQFVQDHVEDGRDIYSHLTNATNTQNIDNVFKAVICTVLSENVENSGFM